MKKNTLKKKSNKMMYIKMLISILVATAYFFIIKMLVNRVYPSNYYLPNNMFMFFFGINCGLFILLGIIASSKIFSFFLKHKIISFIISFVLIFEICLPIILLKGGILANENSIQKKNIFGKTIVELEYDDIESIDVSVRSGIQYNIKFKKGKKLFLCSYYAGIRPFKNDYNLQKFDEIISQYADKTVSVDSVWIRPSNTRRFSRDEKVFKYFDDFFKKYYDRSMC